MFYARIAVGMVLLSLCLWVFSPYAVTWVGLLWTKRFLAAEAAVGWVVALTFVLRRIAGVFFMRGSGQALRATYEHEKRKPQGRPR